MEYRNEPLNVLADDLSGLGMSPEQYERIVANGWSIVWAQRPVPLTWQTPEREYVTGVEWTWWDGGQVTNGHYAAGDPQGDVNGTPLIERWNQYDAYPVRLMDIAELDAMEREVMADYGLTLEELRDAYPDPVRLARDQGMRIIDLRA